jgi:anti-sigma regulatory factor (Ser/Thr protein kinase)
VPSGHRGHFHEASFYDSTDDFLAVAVRFLEQGVEAGEPTLVTLGGATAEIVRRAMPRTAGIAFLDDRDRRSKPARIIQDHREIIAGHAADGAEQIRILGETPHPGHGAPWGWWARYEATINHAFAEFPLWNLCPYDVRITPDSVLDDAARTHPHIATTDGAHLVNPRYQDPAEFLVRQLPGDADPLEETPPVVDLLDPTPAVARQVTRAAGADLPPGMIEVDDMVMAVSEAVTNALLHGRPPVRLRLWSGTDRLVATISDGGSGPVDPFVGLLPTTITTSAGMGLWLAHHLCSHVGLDRTTDGFVLRLVSDSPHEGSVGHARGRG